MISRPISVLIVGVLGIARLVKDVKERFDQLEHKLDVLIDQLDSDRALDDGGRGQSAMASQPENRR
jgi:hypothetical protein